MKVYVLVGKNDDMAETTVDVFKSLKDARDRMFEEWKECLETETTVPLPETRKGNIDDFIGFGFKRDSAWTDWGASWRIFKNDIN